MAMHDLGYRHWDEETPYQKISWLSIARYGARLAWKSRWLKRVVSLSFLFSLGLTVFFFIYEQIANWEAAAGMLVPLVAQVEGDEFRQHADSFDFTPQDLRNPSRIPQRILQEYVDEKRPYFWSQMVYFFFTRGLFITVLVFGMISPRLISHDVQSRAFLLYFSRPITPHQYVLGKLSTIWIFLLGITTLPALFAYLVGWLVSPSLSVIFSTWMVPLRILLATMVIAIPCGLLALCLSSIVRESRYASFAWFAIWVVGAIAYGMLVGAEVSTARSDREVLEALESQRWSFVSLYHLLGQSLQFFFGLVSFAKVKWVLLELAAITVISYVVLMRKVTAPIRI